MISGRLILAGGGIGDDERPLLEHFVDWIGVKAKVLYWPMAQQDVGDRHDQCFAWVKSAFHPMGISNITAWTDLFGRASAELSEYDAVFIGGGCTYLLLQKLRESGFDRVLINYLRAGGTVYGGSAGAIIMGRSIETGAHIDENVCDLSDLRGLNMVQEYGVACHYRTEHQTVLMRCAVSMQTPVVALTERSGLILEKGEFRAAGHDPAYLINSDGVTMMPVGTQLASAH